MLQINVPGMGKLTLTDLMLDYNGTLALDGYLIESVKMPLAEISHNLKIHVVTGDTHGTAKAQLADLNCQLTIVPPENQSAAKLEYLKKLGESNTIAVGNGKNDQQILKEAKIGIPQVRRWLNELFQVVCCPYCEQKYPGGSARIFFNTS